MYTDDRDLLRFAPTIFRDAAWLGQRLFRGNVSVAGAVLTAPADVNFAAAGVRPGGVVVVASASYEIISVSGNKLTISRPRASRADPIIPPTPAAGVEAIIHTFRPQIAAVEPSVLRDAGLDAAGAPAKVLNPDDLSEVVSLRAILLICATAGEGGAGTDWERRRLEYYLSLEHRATRSVSVLLDLNGDGIAEEVRSLVSLRLVRG
ncbi:MAG: hypothetical protein ACOYN0_06885 [Phycisphaerales bacterium]